MIRDSMSMNVFREEATPICVRGTRSGMSPCMGPWAIFELNCSPTYPMNNHTRPPPQAKIERKTKSNSVPSTASGRLRPNRDTPSIGESATDRLDDHRNEQADKRKQVRDTCSSSHQVHS